MLQSPAAWCGPATGPPCPPERARTESTLRYRIAFEELVMTISTRLVAVASGEADAGITAALAEIGRFLDVDRSYIFLFSEGGARMDNTHEWAADGISAERERLQGIAVGAAFPWFARELRERRVLSIPEVGALPPAAAAEREEFEREGIRSLINVALVQGDWFVGFLGLDSVRRQRAWTRDEESLLRVLGELFTPWGVSGRPASSSKVNHSWAGGGPEFALAEAVGSKAREHNIKRRANRRMAVLLGKKFALWCRRFNNGVANHYIKSVGSVLILRFPRLADGRFISCNPSGIVIFRNWG